MNNTIIFYVQSTTLTPEWVPHCHSITEKMTSGERIYVIFVGVLFAALSVTNIMLSIHCNVKLNIFVSSKYKLPLDLRLLFGFICLFCCISSILWFLSILMSYFCLTTYAVWILVGINGDNFYRFGLASLFLLYLIRLNHAFKDTQLALSKQINIFCIIGFIIQLIIPGFTTYFFLQNDWISGLQCVWAVIVINTFFTLYLLVLFVRKIFILASKTQLKPTINATHIINPSSLRNNHECSQISTNGTQLSTGLKPNAETINTHSGIKSHKNNVQSKIASATNTTDEKVKEKAVNIQVNYENQKEIDVFSPTIKYIICAFISIASTNLVSAFIIVRSLGYDDQYAWLASLTSGVLDQTINLYCLYLQLPFANGVYWKCCKKLHLFCMDKSFTKTQLKNGLEPNKETEKVDTVMVNVEETNTLLSLQISN